MQNWKYCDLVLVFLIFWKLITKKQNKRVFEEQSRQQENIVKFKDIGEIIDKIEGVHPHSLVTCN